MITAGKKWHYLAVKKLSVLLRGVTSNHVRDFYYLNCFHSYSTEKNLKKHEKIFNDRDYCYVEMPNEDKQNIKIQLWRKAIGSSIYYSCWKKCTHVKIILKNLMQKKN